MLFNPTTSPLSVTVAIPLYYTGLTTSALVSVEYGPAKAMALGRDYSVQLPLEMAAGSIHTEVFSSRGHTAGRQEPRVLAPARDYSVSLQSMLMPAASIHTVTFARPR